MIFELTRFGKNGGSAPLSIDQNDFTCVAKMAPPTRVAKAVLTASNIFLSDPSPIIVCICQ